MVFLLVICKAQSKNYDDDILYNAPDEDKTIPPPNLNHTISAHNPAHIHKAVEFVARNKEFKEDRPGPYESSERESSFYHDEKTY